MAERKPDYARWADSIERQITVAWNAGIRGVVFTDIWEDALTWWGERKEEFIPYEETGDDTRAYALTRYNARNAIKYMRQDGCSDFWILSQVRQRTKNRQIGEGHRPMPGADKA